MHRLRTLALLLTLLLWVPATTAQAVSLSLEPANVTTAGPFSLDLIASGLGAGVAPSIGGFDVTLGFDDTLLSFASVAFGTEFGTAIMGTGPNGPGNTRAFLVSLSSAAVLDAAQGANVLLASFTFDVASAGTSTVTIASQLISDAFGNQIPIDALGSATVNAVPEPSAALAFGLGSIVMLRNVAARRRRA